MIMQRNAKFNPCIFTEFLQRTPQSTLRPDLTQQVLLYYPLILFSFL